MQYLIAFSIIIGFYGVCLAILALQTVAMKMAKYQIYHFELGTLCGFRILNNFTLCLVPIDAAIDYLEENENTQAYIPSILCVASNMFIYGIFSIPCIVYFGAEKTFVNLTSYLGKLLLFKFNDLYDTPSLISLNDIYVSISFGCLMIFIIHCIPGRGAPIHNIILTIFRKPIMMPGGFSYIAATVIRLYFIFCVFSSLVYWLWRQP